MIVLHVGMVRGRLVAWGEEDGHPRRRPKERRPDRAPTYPHGVPVTRLCEALRSLGVRPYSGPDAVASACVWLPTVDGWPCPSSPLVAERPDGEPDALLPWELKCRELDGAGAIELLMRAGDRPLLAPGVIAGESLRHAVQWMRFAASLVARQRYLPGVVKDEVGDFRARWEPLIAGEDASTAADLAAAAPGVIRALTPGASDPPVASARQVLERFCALIVDHLTRPDTPPKTGLRDWDSLHDEWLVGLQSQGAWLGHESPDLARFAETIRAWRRRLETALAAPYRLTFRMEEPEADDGGWGVHYVVQPADDPSLQIPAADVWAGKRPTVNRLTRPGLDPREFLLTALGTAGTVSRHVDRSLQQAQPGSFTLRTGEAHAFLIEEASALEAAGFGVSLPAWWTRRGARLRLAARARVLSDGQTASSASGISLGDPLQFQWTLALGDQPVTEAELLALAKLKSPLVRFRGQWVEVNAEEIARAIQLMATPPGEASVGDLMRMAVGAATAPGGLPIEGVDGEGPFGEAVARLCGADTLDELPPPGGFLGDLRPYQLRGFSWLAFLRRWGLGACLADDMGLGKTIQTLALIQRDREAGETRPVLLVCPTSVVTNWRKEAERFTPELSTLIHHGAARRKDQSLAKEAAGNAIVITSYSLLHRDQKLLARVPWSGIVLDEAQHVKNAETKVARAARSLRGEYRIALTGTPVENHVGDLRSIMEFLNPGLLGSAEQFRVRFYLPIQGRGDRQAAEQLRRITGPFVLRRLKTDPTIISDLPEKQEMSVYCPLTKEQASLYMAVVQDAEGELEDAEEGIARRGLILATLTRLKQVCNHPAQFLADGSAIPGRSGKLERLTQMVEEVLDADDKGLLFTQFAEMGHMLKAHLQDTFGTEVLFLHGGVTRAQRDRMVERFQSDVGDPRLFVLSLKAGGTGLNLTRANHVFHYDRWWNPAVENQATDRAFRIGQTRNVQVHKFVCGGTLEERISDMIERKREIADMTVGTGEGWLTEMSTDELKALFALSEDAVAE